MKHTSKSISLSLSHFALGAALVPLLMACQTTHQDTLDKPEFINETSAAEYIDEPTWTVNNCKVEAKVDGTRMYTDGTVSHGTIRMTVKLADPSQTFLSASLYGVGGFSMNVVGRKDNWALELPNTPYAAAQMISGKTYLFLTYTPVATSFAPAPLERVTVFPLKELPQALADLEATCN